MNTSAVEAIEDHFTDLGADYDRTAFAAAGLQWVSERELAAVRAAFRDLPTGSRVLDAGCGNGRITELLCELGHSVTTLDPVREMLETTTARAAEHDARVEGVQARLGETLPFRDESFDAVIAMRVLKWVPAWAVAIDELARVLVRNGRLVVELTNRRSLARFGYGATPITLCSVRQVRRQGAGDGITWTDAFAGTHLPHPLWSAARSAGAVRACASVQRGCDALLGSAAARSVVLAGNKIG